MNKRPKSREETPKEGSGNAKRYRTATICGRAAQSARVFELNLVHIPFASPECSTGQPFYIIMYNQWLNRETGLFDIDSSTPFYFLSDS
jgi:hypothetical protein